MRAQFLWQILHTFDNVLVNKKWDGIIVYAMPVRKREGREIRNVWGEIRNVHYCAHTNRLHY
jgi:hypothetical protein